MPASTGDPADPTGAVASPTSPPASPAESLRLIDAQRKQAARAFFGTPVPILALWGVAWTLGFGAYYVTAADGHHLPAWVAGVVLALLGAAATAASVVQFVRQRRGLRGPSPSVAARYFWSWPIATLAMAVFDLGLDRQGLPGSVQSLLWSASFLFVAGLLYLAGGVLFGDTVMFALGAWTVVVAGASTFAGVPGNFAVLSLAGGGGLLLAAAVLRPRFRPARGA